MADEAKPVAKDLPPWAKYWGGIGLTAVLMFLAAKYGIAPTPLPLPPMGTQSTPMVLVIHTGSGQPAYAGANAGCQCPAIEKVK